MPSAIRPVTQRIQVSPFGLRLQEVETLRRIYQGQGVPLVVSVMDAQAAALQGGLSLEELPMQMLWAELEREAATDIAGTPALQVSRGVARLLSTQREAVSHFLGQALAKEGTAGGLRLERGDVGLNLSAHRVTHASDGACLVIDMNVAYAGKLRRAVEASSADKKALEALRFDLMSDGREVVAASRFRGGSEGSRTFMFRLRHFPRDVADPKRFSIQFEQGTER